MPKVVLWGNRAYQNSDIDIWYPIRWRGHYQAFIDGLWRDVQAVAFVD